MIRTLTGSNDFARNDALAQHVQNFIAQYGDMAYEKFDGESTEAARMFEAMQSLPFLTTKKLVVLHEPSRQKQFTETFADIIHKIPDTTEVVIVEPKLDKRLSYYKTLQKQTEFTNFEALDAAGLARWAVDYVKKQGGTLSPQDARYLIERIGNEQLTMQHELEKLLLYAPKISKETIDLLTDKQPQSTVFELLDAAFSGRTAQAIALYTEQRALRVEPQAILAMIVWQAHILAVVKMAGVRPPEEIAKQAKINPFVVRKTQNIARKLTVAKLKQIVADLVQLDFRLKNTATDADEALQLFLLKLAN